MTLARDLSHKTMDRIVERFGLTEHLDGDGPYLPLPGQIPGASGVCRLWSGGPIERMVYVGLAFEPANLDSHMLFAFTPGDSPIPHFTVDSVLGGPTLAFHLDLIPRLDLGSNLAYMDAVYGGITETFTTGRDTEGLSRADLSPRQLALMSPWMLAYRATEDAFIAIGGAVDAYLDHWFDLVDAGLPAGVVADTTSIAARDARNRAALFNADVDPVWNQVGPLIGEGASLRIRALLRGED